MRVQLHTMARFVEDQAIAAALDDLEEKLVSLQMNMVDLRLTPQGQDGTRFEAKLLQKLGYLTGGLSIADFRPTDSEAEVKTILHDQLRDHLMALESLVASDVAALNRMLSARGLLLITDR
jgi:hypothetical protein